MRNPTISAGRDVQFRLGVVAYPGDEIMVLFQSLDGSGNMLYSGGIYCPNRPQYVNMYKFSPRHAMLEGSTFSIAQGNADKISIPGHELYFDFLGSAPSPLNRRQFNNAR
jgi:hypothetical protein